MKKTFSAKNFNLWFGILFGGIGAIFVIVTIVLFIDNKSFERKADKVMGIITEIETYRDTDGDVEHEVYVAYQYDGEDYESRINSYTSSMYEGGRIDLYIDPDNPYKVRALGSMTLFYLIFGGVGSVFFVIGLCFVLSYVMKKSKNDKLIKEGRKLSATITGGEMCYNITINGRHPYKLECTYEDEFTKEKYLYSSEYVDFPPENYYGSRVNVYVDRNDMSHYFVDTNSMQMSGSAIHDFR